MRQGELIAGKYQLVRELGAGSQGRVWEARHLQMGVPLALKLLEPSRAAQADYVSRLQREASAAAVLRSAHVVQIFDFGVSDQIPYIAMELLEGESLGTRLRRVRRLAPTLLSSVVTQTARALERAHKRGIVHRDLKPDNIFLCTSEESETELVKVFDFGVAKELSQDALAHTSTGVVLGTPYYMSPEQAQGKKPLDHRTDLWSLGVIAFEAMIGRRPFEATNLADLLVQICSTPLPVPSHYQMVPEGFDDWFFQACARSSEDRFASAKLMADALAELCHADALAEPPARMRLPPMPAAILSGSVPDSDATIRLAPTPAPVENDPTQVMTDLPFDLMEPPPSGPEIEIPIEVTELNDSVESGDPNHRNDPTWVSPTFSKPQNSHAASSGPGESERVQVFQAKELIQAQTRARRLRKLKQTFNRLQPYAALVLLIVVIVLAMRLVFGH